MSSQKSHARARPQSCGVRPQKKIDTQLWKYTILVTHHEHMPRGGGASEGCRPKLPRWPFSNSGGTQASDTAVYGSMVGSLTRRVKVFVHRHAFFRAPRAARGMGPFSHWQRS